jgi:hypothetical protein
MKALKFIALGLILLVSAKNHAQVSINVNIGTPPSWGPAGYSDAAYYYLPDVEAYYDIRASQFIYFGRGGWIRASFLPRQYRNYDLYHGYKVVLNDYHGNRPYTYFRNHKMKYYKGYRGNPQRAIRDDYNNRRDYDDRNDYDNRGNGNRKGGKEHHGHGGWKH